MNTIKVYMHANKLQDFKAKNPILVKQMPNSQYDIEMNVDLKLVEVTSQEQGLLIRRRSIFEVFLKRWE